jgi:DNA-binding CsgD family transcriptional regulator
MLITAYSLDFREEIARCTTIEMIRDVSGRAARAMGFQLFAVSRHTGISSDEDCELIHNYPADWEARYRREQLGRRDPAHLNCRQRACGFRWREPTLTPQGEAMLDAAKAYGIGDGFTVPGNVYGAARGSVTFATEVGAPFPEDNLTVAQALGNFLFQKMLDLGWNRHLPRTDILTMRQLECVMWLGRGKCNLDIATIMGISINTVKKHLAEACERYDVETRAILPLVALYHGTLQMTDLFR